MDGKVIICQFEVLVALSRLNVKSKSVSIDASANIGYNWLNISQ